MNTDLSLLKDLATSKPNEGALLSTNLSLTFGELFDSVMRFASWLKNHGVTPKDVVALSLDPELDVILGFSCLALGADCFTAPKSTASMQSVSCTVQISKSKIDQPGSSRAIVLDAAALAEIALSEAPSSELRGISSEAGRIFFTSGSTGLPKAVRFSYSELLRRERFVRANRVSGKYMALLGMSSYGGYMTMFSQILNGETYYVPGNAAQNFRLISTQRVDTVFASPAQIESLLEVASKSSSGLRLIEVQSTGFGISPALVQRVRDATGARLKSIYACTESGIVAIKSDRWGETDYAGEVAKGVRLEVVDSDGQPVKGSAVGRVRIAAPDQATAYLNSASTSSERFVGQWFYPGDLGRLEGSSLHLNGRDSAFLNAGGVKLNPDKLETLVLQFKGIDDAAVFEIHSQFGTVSAGLAFVSSKSIDFKELQSFLQSEFGEATPMDYFRVARIPKTELGKPNRFELAQMYRNRID